MPFHDSYDAPQSSFVSTEEKEELEASREAFPITAVRVVTVPPYGDKFFCTITLDGEDRTLSFGKGGDSPVETRDHLLTEYAAWLANGGEADSFVLQKKGRAWILAFESESE